MNIEFLTAIFAVAATVVGIVCFIFLLKNRRANAASAESETRISAAVEKAVRDIRDDAERTRTALGNNIGAFRAEISSANSANAKSLNDALAARTSELNDTLHSRFEAFTKSLADAARAQTETLDGFRSAQSKSAEESRAALAQSFEKLREENSKKLDEMRGIVDEKLQTTLEKRIGESFKQVSERLENVYKSLGEMQEIAGNVNDLKRVLTNVKTRGTWGEVQLGKLLEDFLLQEQFVRNFKPNPRGNEVVEFAIKMPGNGGENDEPVFLPIDSKFPSEDYVRIAAAAEKADADGVAAATKSLAKRIEIFANDIKEKYIKPPRTTDFAVLFLPTDGIYAEVLRVPGLVEKIQRDKRVLIAGPTTLAALVNSLSVGFKTLAIQKNSAQIAKTLHDIKKDFESFGEFIESVSKKIAAAQTEVGKISERYRITTGKLARVERLDIGDSGANDSAANAS